MRHFTLAFALFSIAACTAPSTGTDAVLSTRPNPLADDEALEDAISLHLTSRAEQFIRATDPNERLDTLFGRAPLEAWQEQGRLDLLFNAGDEAFEAELDRAAGVGIGPLPQAPLPARPQRIQRGEIGGLDASSCRSCHFVGGPDGSGSITQLGLFRGDGEHLSSATARDAPHLMGLGYIALMAREIEVELEYQVSLTLRDAQDLQREVSRGLYAKGIFFGRISASPEGILDTSALEGISPDFKIRPFGHKGRHSDLVALADEALQLHHGLQSVSRVETYSDDVDLSEEYLGTGPSFDPDGDGIVNEVSEAQAVLLAGYMSMLPIPEVRPPSNPELALRWASGRQLFETIGCSDCHRVELRFESYEITLAAQGSSDLVLELDLEADGQEPVPRQTDYGQDREGRVPSGVPIFPFTDFKRHDMGPALADSTSERLPGDADLIPAAQWLTRPLWGLADTAPYLHDGRAPTVHDAIVYHGGEGAASRDSYLALTDDRRGEIRAFLMSLTRAPTLLVE